MQGSGGGGCPHLSSSTSFVSTFSLMAWMSSSSSRMRATWSPCCRLRMSLSSKSSPWDRESPWNHGSPPRKMSLRPTSQRTEQGLRGSTQSLPVLTPRNPLESIPLLADTATSTPPQPSCVQRTESPYIAFGHVSPVTSS